jgi:catechol 2,3-dioxygenase-like lactoylglutathione lyase family enzyme
MRMSGPVLDAADVAKLTQFYEQFLGWEIEALEGPRPGHQQGDGWSRLRPQDGATKIEIQFDEHQEPPVWPSEPGGQGMQMHLDIWVEDVAAGVEWAMACGAVEAAQQPQGRDLTRLRVMRDPAGHPFCLWS